MNWTGGRFKRSKANADTLVKTQKQHFAKARLRSRHGQASEPSFGFSLSHGQYGHNTEMQGKTPVNDHHGQRKRANSQEIVCKDHKSGIHFPRSRHYHLNSIAEPRPKRRRSWGHLDRSQCDVPPIASRVVRHIHDAPLETRLSMASAVAHNRKSGEAEGEANTLEYVKRNLLKSSD